MKQRGDMKAVEEFIVLNHGSLEWQLKDEKWIGRVELENIEV